MRLSRVPVLSLYQHDLVYDPGGLCPVSPIATGQILRSSGVMRDHDFQTTFEARYRPC